MIQKADILSFCHSQSFVGIFRDPFILLQLFPSDPGISPGIFHKRIFHGSVLWTGICDTQLPVFIGLFQQRIHHLAEKLLRCFICRHRNTNLRLILPFLLFLLFQFFYIRSVFFIPGSIRHLFWFKTFMKPDPEFLWPVML